jgi:cell division protein FtsL
MQKFILLFILCLFVFGVTVLRTEVNRSGREISHLQNQVEIKEARNQYLQLQISRLASPSNISTLAQEKLGLVPAKPQQVIVLDNE